MRRRRLLSLGALPLALVGAGFYPDARLAYELRVAAADGLAVVPPVRRPPSGDGVLAAYQSVFDRHSGSLDALNTLPGPPFSKDAGELVREAVQVSRRPHLADSDSMSTTESNMVKVARGIAWWANDAEGLLPAARMVQQANASGSRATSRGWAEGAKAVLDAADRLRLVGEDRRRIVAALGPPPDPRALLRTRMIEVLRDRREINPPLPLWDHVPFVRTPRQIRYVQAYRSFWRAARGDDDSFVAAVRRREGGLRRMEEEMNGFTLVTGEFGSGGVAKWGDWAADLFALRRRM